VTVVNLDWFGKEHEDVRAADRAWTYGQLGRSRGLGGSPLAQPISGVVGWPPTGEVYLRTAPRGLLVLAAYGPGTTDQQKHGPYNELAPTLEEVDTWALAQGWSRGVDAMKERMAGLTPKARDASRRSWAEATGRDVPVEQWVREQRRDLVDAAKDAGSRLAQGAFPWVFGVAGLLVVWWAATSGDKR